MRHISIKLFIIVKIIILLIISAYNDILSFIPDTIWTKVYGDDYIDVARSVQQTGDGGFIAVGLKEYSDNSCDVYLIRTDASGDTLWTKVYGGAQGRSVGRSVKQTNDGGFIIAGVFGSMTAFLMKTNSNGDSLWLKNYNYQTEFNCVLEANDGGFAIVGDISTTNEGRKVYLIRTNANGDTLWTRTYARTNNNIGNSLQQLKDEGFIIAARDGNDFYIIRTNSVGDTIWTRTFGGAETEIAFDINETIDSGFIITGWTNSFGSGNQDIYVVRINKLGDTLWTRTFGGTEEDIGTSILRTKNNEFIITGHTRSFGEGLDDIYILRINDNGDIIWTKTIGGQNTDYAYSIEQTDDNGFIIAGLTRSFSSNGSSDAYLVRLGKDSINIKISKQIIYSQLNNPIVFYSHNNITIQYNFSYFDNIRFDIYDIKGKLIRSGHIEKDCKTNMGKTRFGIGNLFTGGIYYLLLYTNETIITNDFLVIK